MAPKGHPALENRNSSLALAVATIAVVVAAFGSAIRATLDARAARAELSALRALAVNDMIAHREYTLENALRYGIVRRVD
ncbi:hypothetical protein [Arenimonas sp.]|uniref:hypothetical protein n=1 Tax=Arenimonas sp. TaxID=1872635 RepID=UPI003C6ED0F2